jgi:DNA-binding NarL/FixJ family response regulator
MKEIRLIVADDHPAMLTAVTEALGHGGHTVVGEARDGEEALAKIEARRPSVAIVDVRMPRMSGIELARRTTAAAPETAVILYTAYGDRALLTEALDAGARGFLLKEGPLTDLARAVRVVAQGGTYVDSVLAGVLAGPDATDRMPGVTKREREILRLLADGMRNEQVARRLSISPLTVRTHVKKAMDKLDADTRTQAVANALRQSLIG